MIKRNSVGVLPILFTKETLSRNSYGDFEVTVSPHQFLNNLALNSSYKRQGGKQYNISEFSKQLTMI